MSLLKKYNLDFLKGDLMAGISVAALSIPVGVAYGDIANLPPESGIYTAIFALLCYFLLGSSKLLIVGPDSATITLFASTVFAISIGNQSLNPQIILLITLMTGILMFISGFLKLGFISNFLSKPILLGYLNGVSLILIVSQLGKFTGLNLVYKSPLGGISELIKNASGIHMPTLIIGIASIILLKVLKRISIKIPSQLILLVISIICVKIFDLASLGISFTGEIKNPYPQLLLPDLNVFLEHYSHIIIASAALVFVSYTGEIPVARTFARDSHGLKPNKEFFALGFADIVTGLFRGFPVSGADSRTAVNVAVGGKTKMVNIYAAAIMLLVILFLSGAFSLIPSVIFGAIIIDAALGMFNLRELKSTRDFSKKEFRITLFCILGVLILGVYQGILIAIILSMIQLLERSSRPDEHELVFDKEAEISSELNDGNKDLVRDDILIYRFNSALVFYNSEYFRDKILERAKSKTDLKTVIIDARAINYIDLTSINTLVDIIKDFNKKNVKVYFAGAVEKVQNNIVKLFQENNLDTNIFIPNVRSFFIH